MRSDCGPTAKRIIQGAIIIIAASPYLNPLLSIFSLAFDISLLLKERPASLFFLLLFLDIDDA